MKQHIYRDVCSSSQYVKRENLHVFIFLGFNSDVCDCIPVWLFRIAAQGCRTGSIYKYLQIKPPSIISTEPEPSDRGASDPTSELKHKNVDPTRRKNVGSFVSNFLRLDGVFLISVLTANAGDVVTADIVGLLWRAWVDRYAGRLDLEDPGDESDSSDEPKYEAPYFPMVSASSVDSGVYGLNQGSSKLILNEKTDI